MPWVIAASDNWMGKASRYLLCAHIVSGCFGVCFLATMITISVHAVEVSSYPWFDLPGNGVVARRGGWAQQLKVVCERTPIAGGCGSWMSFQNSCYNVSEPGYSFSAGRGYCQSLGAHLVVITSSAENDFAHGVCVSRNDEPCYIGLFEDTPGAVENENWQWVDGTPVEYTEWSNGEPSNSRGDEHVAGYLPGHTSAPSLLPFGWTLLVLYLLVIGCGGVCLWRGVRNIGDMALSCMSRADGCCAATLLLTLIALLIFQVKFLGVWALVYVLLALQSSLLFVEAWLGHTLHHGLAAVSETRSGGTFVIGRPIQTLGGIQDEGGSFNADLPSRARGDIQCK